MKSNFIIMKGYLIGDLLFLCPAHGYKDGFLKAYPRNRLNRSGGS
jgi:hypothetical protein